MTTNSKYITAQDLSVSQSHSSTYGLTLSLSFCPMAKTLLISA